MVFKYQIQNRLFRLVRLVLLLQKKVSYFPINDTLPGNVLITFLMYPRNRIF